MNPFEGSKDLAQASSLPFSELWTSEDQDLEVEAWMGDHGNAWADRNPTDAEGTNESWRKRFGVDKVSVIREAIHGVPHDASWLEVGCGGGAHMRCLQAAGWPNVMGCDINRHALSKADNVVWADARSLPFDDDSFDGVTTSGSLMHFGPHERMVDCLHEMCRVARRWIFLIEIYHPTGTLISFGDLMPPAWVMPWREWLSVNLAEGWIGVRGRVMRGFTGADPAPLSVLLLHKP